MPGVGQNHQCRAHYLQFNWFRAKQAEQLARLFSPLVRWTEVGWTDFMAVLARALELGTTHQIPKEAIRVPLRGSDATMFR